MLKVNHLDNNSIINNYKLQIKTFIRKTINLRIIYNNKISNIFHQIIIPIEIINKTSRQMKTK